MVGPLYGNGRVWSIRRKERKEEVIYLIAKFQAIIICLVKSLIYFNTIKIVPSDC